MRIGDKVIQTKYAWGKKADGEFHIYEITSIRSSHPFGGWALDCVNVETGEVILFIPSNTYVELSDHLKDRV